MKTSASNFVKRRRGTRRQGAATLALKHGACAADAFSARAYLRLLLARLEEVERQITIKKTTQ